MTASRQSSYRGATLVSFSTREYNSFTDKQTGEIRPGGVIRNVHLVTSVDAAPITCRVRDEALYEKLTENVGSFVDVVIETRAQGGQFKDEIVSAVPVTSRRKSA